MRSRGGILTSNVFATPRSAFSPEAFRIETLTITGSVADGLTRASAVCRLRLIVAGKRNSRAGLMAGIIALESFSVEGRLQTSRQGDGAAAMSVSSTPASTEEGPSQRRLAQPLRKGRSAEVNRKNS